MAPENASTGRYRNPVLPADWSDPDAIRVGDDFYLTASSFSRVNWSFAGHALDRLEPEETFALPRHDCGVWDRRCATTPAGSGSFGATPTTAAGARDQGVAAASDEAGFAEDGGVLAGRGWGG
jgi:hypothetical protein